MFSIKRKSGTIRKSESPADLEPDKKFIDFPFCGSVCLVDDIEKIVVSTSLSVPYIYKMEDYPVSHHEN